VNDNNFVTINIMDSASAAEKYFCSYCNTRLTPLTQEDMIGAYVCTKCNIQYWPTRQSVKKSSKFDLPGTPTDSHGNVVRDNDIPIAVIDSLGELSTTSYKQQKLSSLFKALEIQGFKVTSY
jgi:hypothetical protein